MTGARVLAVRRGRLPAMRSSPPAGTRASTRLQGAITRCPAARARRELHPTRNPDIDPTTLGAGSSFKAWWRCAVCGHDWPRQSATVRTAAAARDAPASPTRPTDATLDAKLKRAFSIASLVPEYVKHGQSGRSDQTVSKPPRPVTGMPLDASPSWRFRSCAAAQISLDSAECFVAVALVRSGIVGTIALEECARRAASAVPQNRAAEFGRLRKSERGHGELQPAIAFSAGACNRTGSQLPILPFPLSAQCRCDRCGSGTRVDRKGGRGVESRRPTVKRPVRLSMVGLHQERERRAPERRACSSTAPAPPAPRAHSTNWFSPSSHTR